MESVGVRGVVETRVASERVDEAKGGSNDLVEIARLDLLITWIKDLDDRCININDIFLKTKTFSDELGRVYSALRIESGRKKRRATKKTKTDFFHGVIFFTLLNLLLQRNETNETTLT